MAWRKLVLATGVAPYGVVVVLMLAFLPGCVPSELDGSRPPDCPFDQGRRYANQSFR